MQLRKLLIATLGLAVMAGAAGAAMADTPFQQDHPRREEVNHRLNELNRSIREERTEGDISAAQAHRLHRRAHFIRHEERVFARHHGGRLSVAEQAKLSHEETGLHRHIPG